MLCILNLIIGAVSAHGFLVSLPHPWRQPHPVPAITTSVEEPWLHSNTLAVMLRRQPQFRIQVSYPCVPQLEELLEMLDLMVTGTECEP